jgi:hypothetical protein
MEQRRTNGGNGWISIVCHRWSMRGANLLLPLPGFLPYSGDRKRIRLLRWSSAAPAVHPKSEVQEWRILSDHRIKAIRFGTASRSMLSQMGHILVALDEHAAGGSAKGHAEAKAPEVND